MLEYLYVIYAVGIGMESQALTNQASFYYWLIQHGNDRLNIWTLSE